MQHFYTKSMKKLCFKKITDLKKGLIQAFYTVHPLAGGGGGVGIPIGEHYRWFSLGGGGMAYITYCIVSNEARLQQTPGHFVAEHRAFHSSNQK